jgi:hypothetical protein
MLPIHIKLDWEAGCDTNMKLRDRQLGPFTVDEQIGKHIYMLKLPAIVRLNPVFKVNNMRHFSTTSLRLAVLVTTNGGNDDG